MSCSGVVYDDRDWDYDKPHRNFCRCPTCKGFLPRDFPNDKPFTCKKCKTELMVFPVIEDGEEIPDVGKICPLTIKSDKKRST